MTTWSQHRWKWLGTLLPLSLMVYACGKAALTWVPQQGNPQPLSPAIPTPQAPPPMTQRPMGKSAPPPRRWHRTICRRRWHGPRRPHHGSWPSGCHLRPALHRCPGDSPPGGCDQGGFRPGTVSAVRNLLARRGHHHRPDPGNRPNAAVAQGLVRSIDPLPKGWLYNTNVFTRQRVLPWWL